ncbi:DUF1365 domain-containing protein [Demetria terragena]|uniref:DUF1365 domain-containing protein n=1 Tax=Demetria terragena TaxID=63959 RepID=UPI00036EA9EF|nr:DUF1365 domain-containing protein [Demetria terragena]
MTPTPVLTTVRHTRTAPIRHDFSYPGCSWLIDPARVDSLPLWTRPFVSFRAKDHLGDPEQDWHTNVVSFARERGVDLTHGRMVALTGARTLGHVFNPLTVYWCWDAEESLACVIAEVHNTYGERHAYLVRPDDRARAEVDKAFYVSPFNDTSGYYSMSLPPPDDTVDVRITLHRDGAPPFVTRWQGRRATRRDVGRILLRLPLAPHLVSLRIRRHGIVLWLRGLTIQPRPPHLPQEPA